jgi:hypothetical protein
MARNISDVPWVFDATGQGEGLGTSLLTIGTFAAATTDICTMAGHGYTTGNGPVQATTSTTLPAGLALTTNYWIINLSSSTFSLASSLANALAGTAVDVTDTGTGTHTIKQLPVFNHPLFVRTIVMTSAGTGGATEVTEGSGGNSLTGSIVLSTNDREQIVIDNRVDAIYINALPTDAKVYIYAGEY